MTAKNWVKEGHRHTFFFWGGGNYPPKKKFGEDQNWEK